MSSHILATLVQPPPRLFFYAVTCTQAAVCVGNFNQSFLQQVGGLILILMVFPVTGRATHHSAVCKY